LSRFKFFIFLFLAVNQFAFASDSLSVFKKRKIALGLSTAALTGGSLVYLNQAWFAQYNTSKLHFFNDNDEWMQMDKCGHAFTNYQVSRVMMGAMDWAGYSTKKQILIGGLSGFTYMTAIEIMDGYSAGWGFSWGDIGANALGTGMAIGQKLLWKEQRIQLKFSFYSSPYAKYRPNILGDEIYMQVLKDYNGQIYWLSVNPSSFIKKENKFPKWLNIADGTIRTFNRYRQGYLSLDVDFTRIKTKSRFLKSVFTCINVIKIPFPNLEVSEGKLKFNYY
jgi:hypothetical protein